MKTTLITLLCLLLLSCEKEAEIYPDKPVRTARGFHTNKDVRTPKQGSYEGISSVLLHTDSALIQKAFRIIRYQSDTTFLIQWWTHPDTAVLVQVADTMHYIFTTDQTNYSCGEQRVIYDYTVTGYVSHDTIFEAGTVRYRWFYYGVLKVEKNGTWSSWVKFKRTN